MRRGLGRGRRAALVPVASIVLASARPAQLDEARNEVRDSLRSTQFAAGFIGLIFLSDELELSATHYRIDNDVDTELSSIGLPFRTVLHPWGTDARTALYVEGAFGYARASESADDFWQGMLPGMETSIDTDWITYGLLVGLGPQLALGEELRVAAIVNAGLARIENRTDYGGPGADFTSALLDGIAFDWSGSTATLGLAPRVDWEHALDDAHTLEVIARYDVRWTESFAADDRAQEFSSRLQLVTVNAALSGPTGLTPWGLPLGWRTQAGYRKATEQDLFGLDSLFVLGGALELATGERLPLIGGLSLNGAVVLGPKVSGFTIGLGGSL